MAIDCNDKTLGDEGYRLLGKCFRLEAASFIRCDLNDDRMQCLAGLSHLTSLDHYRYAGSDRRGNQEHRFAPASWSACILSGTGVGDAGLKQIGKLPELATLDLSRHPGHRRRTVGAERPQQVAVVAPGEHGGHRRRRGQARWPAVAAERQPVGMQGDRPGQSPVEEDTSGTDNRLKAGLQAPPQRPIMFLMFGRRPSFTREMRAARYSRLAHRTIQLAGPWRAENLPRSRMENSTQYPALRARQSAPQGPDWQGTGRRVAPAENSVPSTLNFRLPRPF